MKPGRGDRLQHGFVNQGDQPVDGFAVTIKLPRHATFKERYSDCTYGKGGRTVSCAAPDFRLAPGEGVNLSGSFTVKVSKRAPGPVVLGRGAFTVSPVDSASVAVKSKGSYAAAVAGGRTGARALGAGEMVEGDNTVTFAVKTRKSTSDLSVKAARTAGAVGERVKVRFTVVNHGPADIAGFGLEVNAPARADIDGSPSDDALDCEDHGDNNARQITCKFHGIVPGNAKARTFTIPFTVTSEKAGDKGMVRVTGFGDSESNPENDTAPIAIVPPGSDGGSGGGSDLPVTGVGLTAVIGVGLAALAAGGGLHVMTRRRRAALQARQ